MTRPLQLKEGDIIGPLQRFSYIRDLPPKKRKSGTARIVEVQDIYTKEIFSAYLSDIRTGHTKYPPSLSRKKMAEHRRIWKKDEIKIIEDQPIKMVDDSEDIPKGSDNSRRYVFENLKTNIRFTDTVSHVTHGYNLGIKRSKGEYLLRKILVDIGIEFIPEYSFKDCINPHTGGLLKFDFYLPSYNCCIEYDGEQHFKGWRKSSHPKSSLQQVRFRDKIKNEYCKEHNIILIRIPYTEYNKIDSQYVLHLFNKYGIIVQTSN